jgi:hypothetical protein
MSVSPNNKLRSGRPTKFSQISASASALQPLWKSPLADTTEHTATRLNVFQHLRRDLLKSWRLLT